VIHKTTVQRTADGYQGICICGWAGREKDRMSDDYAWTNASDDAKQHERSIKPKCTCADFDGFVDCPVHI